MMQWFKTSEEKPVVGGLYFCKAKSGGVEYKCILEWFINCWIIEDESIDEDCEIEWLWESHTP